MNHHITKKLPSPEKYTDFNSYLNENTYPKENSVIWEQPEILEALNSVDFSTRGALFLSNPGSTPPGETVSDISLTVQVLRCHEHTTPHTHSFWHIYFVISGAGEILLEDEKKHYIQYGDVIYIPAWTSHQFINNKSEDLLLYAIQNLPEMAQKGTLLRSDGSDIYSVFSK